MYGNQILFLFAKRLPLHESDFPCICFFLYSIRLIICYNYFMKKKLPVLIIFLFVSCMSLWCESKFSAKEWKKLSADEKTIVLLTASEIESFGIDYCDFECKSYKDNDFSYLKDELKERCNITDRKSFDEYLQKAAVDEDEFEFIKLNSGKTFVQVLESVKSSDSYYDGDLLYFYENYPKLGKHGLEAEDISIKLFIIRLGYSAGFITKKEMIKLSSPFIEKALSDYKNMEDFAAHNLAYFFMLDFSVCNVLGRDYTPQKTMPLFDTWKEILNELPAAEIKFNGKDADKYSMKLEDAIYVPAEEYQVFVEYLKNYFKNTPLSLPVVHKCYEQYGHLNIIKDHLISIEPAEYDKKTKKTREQFFEENYRSLWNSLDEYEKFLISCSCVFFEINSQFHLDIASEVRFESKTKNATRILNENWNINSYEELMAAYNKLAEGEQDASFRSMLDLYNENPNSSEIEICEKENYNIVGLSRFYLAGYFKDKIGSHCLEAWVEGRKISLIRWGIGAGYISYKDGINLIKPIAEKLKDDYVSFDDFIGHWIAGYCYNDIYNATTKNWIKGILEAIENSRAYIPLEELNFTGKNADKNHVMTAQDGIYKISDKAAQYMTINKLYCDYSDDKADKSTLKNLIAEENKYPEITGITFYFHYNLICQFSSTSERVAYMESKIDYVNSLAKNDHDYILKEYFSDLLKINKCEKVLELYDSLPQDLKTDEDFYYFYAYANYLKSLKCESIIERDVYSSRAFTALIKLNSMGYELDPFMIQFLQNTAY